MLSQSSAGLIQGRDRAIGIFDDAELAVTHRFRPDNNRTAVFTASLGTRVNVGNGDVDEPLRGQFGIAAPGMADAGGSIT